MIDGLYIISQAGLPLYSYNKTPDGTNFDTDVLFTGLITAIKKFLLEINVGEVRHFSTESHQVQIFSEENYAIVLIYSHDQGITSISIKELYNYITEELEALNGTMNNIGDIMNNEISGFLSLAISRALDSWERYLNQSSASRKVKESLW